MAPIIAVMMAAGATFAFVLPLMPFIFWILAVTGYFLLIVEAVVAVNLWALGHMRLDGEGISGDAGRNGWLMLLSLVMTPPLMVLGYLIGMILFRVSSALIDIGIHQAASGIFNGNPFSDLIAIIAFGILICVIYIALLERSFSLVSEFPGRVLRWMGAEAHLTNGEENKARMAAGGSIAGIHQAGGKMTAGAGSVAQKVGLGANGRGYDYQGNKRAGSLRQYMDTRRSGVQADKKDETKPEDPRATPIDDTGGTSG